MDMKTLKTYYPAIIASTGFAVFITYVALTIVRHWDIFGRLLLR